MLASGKQGSKSMPVLEPIGPGPPDDRPLFDPARITAAPAPPDPATFLELDIAEPTEEWPPAQGDAVTVTVRFSDIYGFASYRLSMAADLRRAAEPGLVPIEITRQSLTERVPPAALRRERQ
jgi:hypothetical protein